MQVLSNYIISRAKKTSEKRAKFGFWGSIMFVLVGLTMFIGAESTKDIIIALATVGVFGWNAWVSSKVLALKARVS